MFLSVSYYNYDTTQQTQAVILRHCSTTIATGPMLPCRQDVAMMQEQEERHRDKQSTLQRYEFHFTSVQRTSRVTYFAVRKTTQHELPQLKLGPTIYAIGLPVNKPEKSSTTCCSNFVLNLVNCVIRIENSIVLSFAKSRNLIGTLGIAKFGPK